MGGRRSPTSATGWPEATGSSPHLLCGHQPTIQAMARRALARGALPEAPAVALFPDLGQTINEANCDAGASDKAATRSADHPKSRLRPLQRTLDGLV